MYSPHDGRASLRQFVSNWYAQYELAELLGVQPRTALAWLERRHRPQARHVKRLTRALQAVAQARAPLRRTR